MFAGAFLIGILAANCQFATCDGGLSNKLSNNSITLQHFGNKSYYISYNIQGTWIEADKFCKDIHMKLVSVKSEEENNKLYEYIMKDNKQEHFWTAGSRLLDKKTWVWMTTGEEVDYTNWAHNQPDSNDELCIELVWFRNKGLEWNDKNCDLKINFICEKHRPYNDAGLSEGSHGLSDFHYSLIYPKMNLLHYKGKSYYVSNNFQATFLDATQFCQMIQMQLVSITSDNENTRLHKYIRDNNSGSNFWSSGSRVLDGKTWIWWATGKNVEYTHWVPGQPDSQNEYCIELIQHTNDGLFWNDLDCTIQRFFICQRDTYNSPRPMESITDPVSPPISPPKCQSNEQPVKIHLYVTNNVLSNGTFLESKKLAVSKDPVLHGSYSVQVNNDFKGPDFNESEGYGVPRTN